LKLDGRLEQSATGTLEFEIGGTQRGALYDGLDVSGGLQAGGRVVVKFVGGFAPQAGDQFELIHAAVSGAFAGFEIENLAPGFQYSTSYQGGVLTLTALNDGVYIGDPPVPGLGVLANDTDADGDPLRAVLVSRPTGGDLTFYADGSFTYLPGPDFAGIDSFQYRAFDGFYDSTVTAVTIIGEPVIDPPLAPDDFYETSQDVVLTVPVDRGVTRNDDPPDDDPLTAVLADDVRHGVLTLDPDGSFTYEPHAAFVGVDEFTYVAYDGPVEFSTARVTIVVRHVFYPGDANLDGKTDIQDFNIWNTHKFNSSTNWLTGDFDGNGRTDVRDFNIWNEHKFTSASAPAPAPVDAALDKVLLPEHSDPAQHLAKFSWLYAAEQADSPRHSSDRVTRVEAAVDELLASYWA
jgi:hypothetical protein